MNADHGQGPFHVRDIDDPAKNCGEITLGAVPASQCCRELQGAIKPNNQFKFMQPLFYGIAGILTRENFCFASYWSLRAWKHGSATKNQGEFYTWFIAFGMTHVN